MRILLAAIAVLSWASIPGTAQDGAQEPFQAELVKGKVQVEGKVDLPDEAILDVILERSMNEANFARPFLRGIRSDMPVRQWVEVKKGEFKATFQHSVCPGYYFVRIEFLTKFQRSNKVGQALTKGALKEFSKERKVMLGTTEELLEVIRQSVAPVEAVAKKLSDAILAMSDPKAEMSEVSRRFDRLSDEIDRLFPTSGLPATLHALKGQCEVLAIQARGTGAKRDTGGGNTGGANPPPLRRPGGGGEPSMEGAQGDKSNPGMEEGFLKPNEVPPHQEGDIKLGDRFGKGKTTAGGTNESPSEPIEKAKGRLSGIYRLISREIAVLLLERSQDLTESYRRAASAGLESQMQQLSAFHASRAGGVDENSKTYLEATQVENLPMSKYWEKAARFCGAQRPAPGPELDALSREVEDLWSKFDQMIRNRP